MSIEQAYLKNQNSTHILWIDIIKGIGIILVVIAHIKLPNNITSEFIYTFHMPLFFLIGGYLHKPTSAYIAFFKRKTKHLLIPYCIFLFLIFIFHTLLIDQGLSIRTIAKYIYGGALLTGWFGVFWFITCFFITQQVFNLLITKYKIETTIKTCLCLLVLSYINSYFFSDIIFPWAINVSLYALPLYLMGFLLKEYNICKYLIKQKIILFILTVITIIIFYYLQPYMFVDLKYSNYGIPFFSILCTFIVIFFIITFAIYLEKHSILYKPLINIGKASMIIMYLHQPIQLILSDYFAINSFTRFIAAIIIPIFSYQLMRRNKVCRQLFLGEFITPKNNIY